MNINYDSPFNFKPIPAITPLDGYWQNGTWKFNMSEISAGATYQPSWIDIILKGNTALTLVNAKANGLNYLKLFGDTEQLPETYLDTVTLSGGCEQSGTPTPSQPLPIVCNNGVIKCSANMCDVNADNVVVGQYISAQGVVLASDANFIYAKYIPVKPNTTYTLTMSTPLYFVSISEYSSAQDSGFIQRNTYSSGVTQPPFIVDECILTTSANTNYLRFGSNMFNNTLTLADVLAVNYMLVQGSAQPYRPYGQIYTDGTVETVTDSNGLTASAERLLAVGDFKDTQEVLTGAVTRNIGIKVLDGTEDWKASTTYNGSAYMSAPSGYINNVPLLCTHFVSATQPTVDFARGKCLINGSSLSLWYGDNKTTAVADIKQFLAQQYAQGTPVIVVYPLATATTSTVTPQLLLKSPVIQTAGSISNLPIAITESSHTVPTPQQPLPVNCNNGVLGIDNQGNITVTGTTEMVEVTGKNLFNKNDAQVGKNWNGDNMAYSIASDYIPAKKGDVFTLSVSDMPKYTSTTFAALDSDYTYLGAVGNGSAITQDACAYIKLSIRCASTDSWTQSDLDNAKIQLEYGTTATTYEPYYYGGQATAEMLLKVGTYQDVQSVLDGEVTRKVGVKVLDGTESWTYTSGTYSYFRLNNANIGLAVDKSNIYCTHAVRVPDGIGIANNNQGISLELVSNVDTIKIRLDDVCTASAGNIPTFKAWLATQYQNGQPVIIVYPLATATTSTVTAQPLSIQEGTNIVQITQASMDNLELEVSYKAGVTVTITEIENAQLDNSVEVTIQ